MIQTVKNENQVEGEFRILEEKEIPYRESEPSHASIKLTPDRILITYILMIVNISVWLVMNLFGILFDMNTNQQLVVFGAKVNELIAEGQLWRLLSAMFLHVNLIHLFFNTYALFIYGPIVEKIYGRIRFSVIYLISGFIGTLASYVFNPFPAAGASGAIFGLMGAIIYLRRIRTDYFRRVFGPGLIMIILLNLLYGFTHRGIDNWGHIGGIAGGFITSHIVGLYGDKIFNYRKVIVMLMIIVLVLAGLFYAHSRYI